MPIPTPRTGEPSKMFISRCVSSDVMQKEYPDRKQRLAVCYSSLRKKRKGALKKK